jgi:hypothetical protein
VRWGRLFGLIKNVEQGGQALADGDRAGVRMMADLISCRRPSRTAGMFSQPGRAAMRSGRKCLPHQEPMMIRRGGDDLLGRRPSVLGQRRTGTLGEDVLAAGEFDQLRGPADTADQRLVPFLEIDARFPAAARMRSAAMARVCDLRLQFANQRQALASAPTSRPTVSIMPRMSSTLRMLKA